jgi:ribosome-binding protein aMBF1 (putative translation factor)
MNTNYNKEQIHSYFNNLFSTKTKEEIIANEAMMLHFRVMQLVEQAMEKKGWTKKQLAGKIETSQSYLTQLFLGDKTVNFKVLAKFQDALEVSFKLDTEYTDETLVAWKIRKTPPSENADFKPTDIEGEVAKNTCKDNLAA